MKNRSFLFFALVALLSSCSEDVLKESTTQSAPQSSSTSFSFESITAPSNWAQYKSLEEMLAACQIPEDKLKTMPTDELIEVCMSHPLHTLYFAYNNELDGAKVVISNFNGFTELSKRTDAPEKMLAFYKNINFNGNVAKAYREDFSKVTYMGFVELYIASKELTSLYEGENLERLERISSKVLEKKLKHPSINTVRYTLLINSQVKLAEGALSAADAETLKAFVAAGGNVDSPQEYSKVSAIVSR